MYVWNVAEKTFRKELSKVSADRRSILDDTALLDYMTKMRRSLHSFPELSDCEYLTSDFIRARLEELGYTSKRIHTGLFVDVEGEKKDERIALRADIDGLPIVEKTGRPFAAKTNMHACGHDGHIAIMLGMAKILSCEKPRNNVRLIFQFGEEGEGGADKMIKQGVIDGVDSIFAFHLCPELDKGKMASCVGSMFAGAVEYNVVIDGKSSHCASREKGRDALAAATEYVVRSKEIEAKFHGTLSHIGKLVSGSARNIVSNNAEIFATFRYFEESERDGMTELARSILSDIDRKYGTESRIEIGSVYPPLVNSAKALSRMKRVAKIEDCAPRYTAEDFAFYTRKIDGAMIWLGTREEGMDAPLHSDKFDFSEDALLPAVQALRALLIESEDA